MPTQRTLKKMARSIAELTFLAFLVLVFVGLFNCVNPVMQNQMSMGGSVHSMALADCIPGSENCGMDINKHLTVWQSMFTVNISNNIVSLFVKLLALVFIFGIYKVVSTWQTSSALASRYLYYERAHRNNKLYNYLLRIFSSGIVEPRLYA